MARSAERRQQPRTPVHPFHGLRVAFRDQTHCLRHFPAKVIDISTGGIGVMMLAPLAPATRFGSPVTSAGMAAASSSRDGLV
jgi:hypothetical protein